MVGLLRAQALQERCRGAEQAREAGLQLLEAEAASYREQLQDAQSGVGVAEKDAACARGAQAEAEAELQQVRHELGQRQAQVGSLQASDGASAQRANAAEVGGVFLCGPLVDAAISTGIMCLSDVRPCHEIQEETAGQAEAVELQRRLQDMEAAARLAVARATELEARCEAGAVAAEQRLATLSAERDDAVTSATQAGEAVEAMLERQARLVGEMAAQEERLQALLGGGAIDKTQLAAMLCRYFTAETAEQRDAILAVVASTLDMEHDQYVALGLRSRWETLQPEISAEISAGRVGISDAFATFLASEQDERSCTPRGRSAGD
jgi:hypothetical protein